MTTETPRGDGSNVAEKDAVDALMGLPSKERLAVTCWFCDACGEYVGPREAHHCEMGSLLYTPYVIFEPTDELSENEQAVLDTLMALSPKGRLVVMGSFCESCGEHAGRGAARLFYTPDLPTNEFAGTRCTGTKK